MASTCVGTPIYLSPELCQDVPYSSRSDIWALGCLLYEICALRPPFAAMNLLSLFYKITKGEYDPVLSVYSENISSLIQRMLCLKPENRPSAACILSSACVQHQLEYIKHRETQTDCVPVTEPEEEICPTATNGNDMNKNKELLIGLQNLTKLYKDKELSIESLNTVKVPSKQMKRHLSSCVNVFKKGLEHLLQHVKIHRDSKVLGELRDNLESLTSPSVQMTDTRCKMEKLKNISKPFELYKDFLRILNSKRR
eukprot:superscaffoldBa00000653_g6329